MDSKPTLKPHQDHVGRLRGFGYNEQEARFLDLAATHSGYFTRHQFLRFTRQTKGCLVHRFTTKLLAQRQTHATQYGRKTYVFKLTSRKFYDLIGKQNLFHEQLGVPASLFPGQTDRTAGLDPTLNRYFRERFPVFVSPRNGSEPVSDLPTFVYCDPAHHGISWFAGYLDRHQVFLRRLPAFNLIYATPGQWKLERASQVFTAIFRNANHPDPEHLTRYFRIRRLWETGQNGSLTRADRDLLRAGNKRYRGEPFESAYQKWFAAGLPEVDLDALLGPSFLRQELGFQTYLLPDSYDFLCCQNACRVRPSPKNARSASRSASRSTGTRCN